MVPVVLSACLSVSAPGAVGGFVALFRVARRSLFLMHACLPAFVPLLFSGFLLHPPSSLHLPLSEPLPLPLFGGK